MSLRLAAALRGDLRKVMKAELLTAENAVTRGVRSAALGLRLELRGQVRGAGLGNGIANAVRQVDYPKSGKSLGPASLVYSKAPVVHQAFNADTVVRPKQSAALAIPTDNVPRQRGRRGGRQMSPVEVEAAFNQELDYIPANGSRPALLVLHNVTASFNRKSGRLRGFRNLTARREASGRGATSVVMFILVRQVTLRRRLDFEGAGRRWLDRLPGIILSTWRTESGA